MRLFLVVGLALIVGLGAAFRPGDNLPGREVGAAESSRVIGGNGQACETASCGITASNDAACPNTTSPGSNVDCSDSCAYISSCNGGGP
jgi:hypothetical protein